MENKLFHFLLKIITKTVWIIFVLLVILVGCFPFIFYILDIPFGIIGLKEQSTLVNTYWKIGFHTHIVFGALALFIGWVQFIPALRKRSLRLHRLIGKIYVFSVLLSSVAGISSSFYANGGIMAFLGLLTIGCIWFTTTYLGYSFARKQMWTLHQNMMMYSYAATFGGVTLRIWLPLLSHYTGDFDWSYDMATWLSWVPNLLVAKWLIEIQKNNQNHLTWETNPKP